MRLALREAERAAEHDDVPIGAVVVREGEVIAAAGNERELRGDPTAHAEVLALREAARELGGWRVSDSVLYVTLEPCAMCAGAIVLARVPRVVVGAPDPKAGAAGSVMDVLGDERLNHRPRVDAGLLAGDSAALLTDFFAAAPLSPQASCIEPRCAALSRTPREKGLQLTQDRAGVLDDVAPRVAAELVAAGECFAFAAAIGLPGVAGPVVAVAVELDGKALPRPAAVDSAASRGAIRLG